MTDPDIETVMKSWHYWSNYVKSTATDTVRWAIHGHLGLKLIWECYARCLIDVTGSVEARSIEMSCSKGTGSE